MGAKILSVDICRRRAMERKWEVVHIVLESVTMAFSYGLALISLMWELFGFLTLWSAIGIFMNVLICTRAERKKKEDDIYWFD